MRLKRFFSFTLFSMWMCDWRQRFEWKWQRSAELGAKKWLLLVELFITCAGMQTDVLCSYGRSVSLQLKRYHLWVCGGSGSSGPYSCRTLSTRLLWSDSPNSAKRIGKKRLQWERSSSAPQQGVSGTVCRSVYCVWGSWVEEFSHSIYDMSRISHDSSTGRINGSSEQWVGNCVCIFCR